MACGKCSDGQREPALLQLIRNRTRDGQTCELPQYCTMRECINEKAGEDATIPPEYWDLLNDILQRVAALENNTGVTIDIPGGSVYLTTSASEGRPGIVAVPTAGKIIEVTFSALPSSTFHSLQLKRNGTVVWENTSDQPNKQAVVVEMNQQVVRGDLLEISASVSNGPETEVVLEQTADGWQVADDQSGSSKSATYIEVGISLTIKTTTQILPLKLNTSRQA